MCRSDSQYLLKTYSCLIDSIDSLIIKFKEFNKIDKACYFTAYILLDVYYSVNKPLWRDKNNLNFLTKLENRACEFFEKYKDLWLKCSQKMVCEISQDLRKKTVSEGMLLEELTINQWLNKIVTDYSNKK